SHRVSVYSGPLLAEKMAIFGHTRPGNRLLASSVLQGRVHGIGLRAGTKTIPRHPTRAGPEVLPPRLVGSPAPGPTIPTAPKLAPSRKVRSSASMPLASRAGGTHRYGDRSPSYHRP